MKGFKAVLVTAAQVGTRWGKKESSLAQDVELAVAKILDEAGGRALSVSLAPVASIADTVLVAIAFETENKAKVAPQTEQVKDDKPEARSHKGSGKK